MAQCLSEIPRSFQRSPCSVLLDFQSCDPSLRTWNQQKWLVGRLQPFKYRVRLANSVRLGCVCKYWSLIPCTTCICVRSQYSVLMFIHWQTWTFMHLYYPHSNDNNCSTISSSIRKCLSPSRKTSNTNEKYFFSVFHWGILAFPHVVTFIHWAVIVPRNEASIPSKNSLKKP